VLKEMIWNTDGPSGGPISSPMSLQDIMSSLRHHKDIINIFYTQIYSPSNPHNVEEIWETRNPTSKQFKKENKSN
jgi:hypothetical protein